MSTRTIARNNRMHVNTIESIITCMMEGEDDWTIVHHYGVRKHVVAGIRRQAGL
jgi:hypothetical protein